MEFIIVVSVIALVIWLTYKNTPKGEGRQVLPPPPYRSPALDKEPEIDRYHRGGDPIYSLAGRDTVIRGAQADRIDQRFTGFWWHRPPCVALAAGRGFNQDVAGESYRQAALLDIVGGKARNGCRYQTVAQLALPEDRPDHPEAVAVMIDAQLVGFIPKEQAAQVKSELEAIPNAENGVTCKAIITGGWDRRAEGGTEGSFGVKLSLARPLRARNG